MADKGFNGSSVVWNGQTLDNEILSVNFSQKKAKVKLPPETVGGAYVYVQGIKELEITVKVAGGAALTDDNASHDLTLNWNDGTPLGNIDDARLFDTDVEGSQDSPISTTFKFAPGPAA